MGIKVFNQRQRNVFGFEVVGKLTPEELHEFSPNIEAAVVEAKEKIRLLIDVTKMDGANIKGEWKIFKFFKKHMEDIEYIAIVGAHSWTKTMSDILAESIFVEAETRYFKSDEIDGAWTWLTNAAHPKHIRIRKVAKSDSTGFTQYSSPDYI
jgi:hypothetical protein